MEEREIVVEDTLPQVEMVEEKTEENIMNDKGFAFMYNLTMVSAVATVAMFVIGTALYIAIMS